MTAGQGSLFEGSDEADTFAAQPPAEPRARRDRDEHPRPGMEVLVTVKAYPALSTKHGEVVCVAGIRTDGPTAEWVRLFPVAFRDRPFADRFAKYQHVTVDVHRPASDRRPESWTPNLSTLSLGGKLDSKRGWAARRAVLDRVGTVSMCALLREQAAVGTSLATVAEVDVLDLSIKPAEEYDAVKAGLAGQGGLFGPSKVALEPAPYTAKYVYRCAETGCRTHTQTLIDWEFVESCRSWRTQYADEPTLLSKLREKWLDQMCGPARDTSFFVGNQHLAPKGFLVLGVFWPPAQAAADTGPATPLPL